MEISSINNSRYVFLSYIDTPAISAETPRTLVHTEGMMVCARTCTCATPHVFGGRDARSGREKRSRTRHSIR